MAKMNEKEAIEYFNDRVDHPPMLRSKFHSISDLLRGEFIKGYNYYEFPNGIIVSRSLTQGKNKNSTVGLILTSEDPINIPMKSGYTETMVVLEGVLNAFVSDGSASADKKESLLRPFGAIVAPYGKTLHLQVKTKKSPKDVLYLCMYKFVN